MTEHDTPPAGQRERRKLSTRRALEDAALRRFARDGYDRTTAEAIAADAGVSVRTFFRYFATKDEVWDMGREERQALLRAEILAAPRSVSDLEAVRRALLAMAAGFEADRDRVVLRQRAAERSVVVRGRLFDLLLSWELVIAAALAQRHRRRGADPRAEAVAALGVAGWRVAMTRWLRHPTPGLAAHLEAVFDQLGDLTE